MSGAVAGLGTPARQPGLIASGSKKFWVFQRRGDTLTMNPVIPKDWSGFRLRYRFQNTTYRIAVENPDHCSRGVILMELDGVSVAEKTVRLRDDGLAHEMRVVMGNKPPV